MIVFVILGHCIFCLPVHSHQLIAKAQENLHVMQKPSLLIYTKYSATCLKLPLKNRQNKGLKDRW